MANVKNNTGEATSFHVRILNTCMAATVDLIMSKDKTKLTKVKTVSTQRVMLTKGPTEELEEFTYLGSV